MKLGKGLVMRAARDGKTGVFAIPDMGSFFLSERIDTLLEYERGIPIKMDFKFIAICSYHRGNFDTLTEQQQKEPTLMPQYCYWS